MSFLVVGRDMMGVWIMEKDEWAEWGSWFKYSSKVHTDVIDKTGEKRVTSHASCMQWASPQRFLMVDCIILV
jgi:hypothetical protein